MKIKNTLLVLLIIFIQNTYSANDIYFSKIGIEQGLSQLSVQCIYQDELGTLWFSTREGLNRYNGNSMDVFRAEPNDSNSLTNNIINNVCGDKNGHVFIHSQNGVNQFNLRSSTMHSIERMDVDCINYGIQNLWIAKRNKLYKYKDGKEELYCVITQIRSPIIRLLETVDQRIIIGTVSSGVFVIDQNKKNRNLITDCSRVANIFEDSKRNIWICTWENGLYKIDLNNNIVNYRHIAGIPEKSISSNYARVVCEDNNGYIWIGTSKGLDQLMVETGIFRHYNSDGYNNHQLSNESVWSLIKDNQGTIWVGTYFGGVNYFNPDINYYTFHNLQNGILLNRPFPIISNIVEDKNGNMFLCSEGNGLIWYNVENKSYKVYRKNENNTNCLTSDNIKAVFFDQNRDELWLGTHIGGLCVFNTKTIKFTQYRYVKPEWQQTDILSSIQSYGNNLIVGTHGGLFLFDRTTKKFKLFSERLHKSVSFIQDAKTDNSGNLWVASLNGLWRYNLKTEKITSFQFHLTDTNSLSNNNVSKILVDSKNRLWIATSGGGINLFNPKNNNFRHFDSKKTGLINDFVSNMLESKFGYLIISTTKGFSMLDVENRKIQNFSSENGLPLNSLYSGGMCLSKKGDVYLTGMNGMVSFNEENLSVSHRPFNLNLVNLWINNKLVLPNDETHILETSLPYSKNIELNHQQTMLTIEFASNNYIPANQPIYRYRLEGFSDTWTELPQGITKLNFMNLGSGKYKLVVQAISPINSAIISFTDLGVRVYPPFYFAWYAWLFYVMVVIFIVWRYLEFSRSKLLLETSLTYEKKEKEHIEEVNQSKLRFFTNISHEFRTPLTLIVGQVDMLLQMHNIQPTIYNRILNIKRNTLNMTNLINELLEFRKSEQGHLNIKVSEVDLVKFLYEIYLSFSEYANYRNIKLNFDCIDEKIKVWIDHVQMQKVFYNLISNAFKFTPKDGTITISINEVSDKIYVKITDSGIGIASEELDKIFDRFYQAENGLQINNMVPGTGIGLALTKNIIELHSADIQVESQTNVGSRFTVILKKGNTHFKEENISEFENVDNTYMNQIHEIDNEFMQEVMSTQVKGDKPHYTMLIVEDNDELRAMLINIFEPIYNIFTAVNGKEGLDKTIEHQPDIVLSDLMMPLMSGSEMCSKIKNNFAVCHIPVILLTAQTAVEYNIEGLRLGADDYITKPFNIKTLITRCNNLVNGRKLLQEKFSHQTDLSPRLIATNNMDREFLDKAMEVIERNMHKAEFDVQVFSSEMALGRTKLFSKIKGITGQTPNDFIVTVKMKKAAVLLTNNPEYNISDITYMLGFSSPKYFAKCFKEQFGVSPSTFRKSEDTFDEKDDSPDLNSNESI